MILLNMMTATLILNNIHIFILGLCWGSFLNVVAYRLLHGGSIIWGRSKCPSCKTYIAWYDLIPLFSWIYLRGQCRTCHASISYLYPLIEIGTALFFFLAALRVPSELLPATLLFISYLMINIRTDLEVWLLLRYFTLGLIPLGIIATVSTPMPITFLESIIGAIGGYGMLWIVRWVHTKSTGTIGMGQGDLELLAGIGAWVGLFGAWITLTLASIIALCSAGIYFLFTRTSFSKMPFGPFLSIGGIIIFLFYQTFLQFFFV